MLDRRIMPSYDIYRHPGAHLIAIKNGWNWPAFLYSGFWALHQRHWAVAGGYAALVLVCAFLETQSAWFGELLHSWFVVLGFLIAVVFGAKGSDLTRKRVHRMGYRRIRDVEADTAKNAVQAYKGLELAQKERQRNRRKTA